MNPDDRIEAALRRRPSDERAYGEGLRLPVAAAPRRLSAAPALLAMCLVLILGSGIIAVLLAQPSGPTATRTSAPSSPAPTATPGGPLVSCLGSRLGFAPTLLSGPATAESDDSAPAAALRLLLGSPYGQQFPRTGWRQVAATPDEVLFVAGTGQQDFPYAQVTVKRETTGQLTSDGWSVDNWGGCKIQALPPDGFVAAAWKLDPATALTPDATDISILVSGEACLGSDAVPSGTIHTNVDYQGTAIVITVTIEQPVGPQPCTTPTPVRLVLHLGEPLNGRALMDGGRWPAVEVVPGTAPSPTS